MNQKCDLCLGKTEALRSWRRQITFFQWRSVECRMLKDTSRESITAIVRYSYHPSRGRAVRRTLSMSGLLCYRLLTVPS